MGWGIRRPFALCRARYETILPQDRAALHLLQQELPEAAAIAHKLRSPVWYGGQVQWLPTGQAVFTAMLEDIRRATTSVWLEYDRLSSGVMWDTILMALRQCAARGVEVRLIYNRLSGSTPKQLAWMHIQALPLPFPLRTHRQTAIIDAAIAYIGGVGMSDGQIGVNRRIKPGKDGAFRIEAPAVRGYSAAFAALWETVTEQAITLPPEWDWGESAYVYMQPFWDTAPLSKAMLRMIIKAQSELWLILPSLWDAVLYHALLQAAQSGVRVHLLISGKGFGLSRLSREGVKVYPFPSGAFHAKVLCTDSQLTLLDTGKRSLLPYLGSGLWLYGQDAAASISAAIRRMIVMDKHSSPTPQV